MTGSIAALAMKRNSGCARLVAMALWIAAALIVALPQGLAAVEKTETTERKLLYVAEPGIRDYLQYGGHGLLVVDIGHGHPFGQRIPASGLDEHGRPLN